MAVFKRKRKVKQADGRTVVRPSRNWYVKYRDADRIIRCVPGYADKEATKQLEARLVKEAALAKEGVIDRYKDHRARPLREHLEDFRQSLLAKGNDPAYVAMLVSRATRVLENCRFTRWSDIQASRVQTYLGCLRSEAGGISAQTFNFYLQAFKQFCRWMVQDQRASDSPVAHLKGLNVRTDRRHDRRSLEPDEVRRLLEATQAAPERFGMSGTQRAMLYRLAVESGLRANELRTLKVLFFDLERCTVTVQAGYSKRKREDVLPLRPDTAAELRTFLSGKLPNARAFDVPEKPARMLRADLADAEIAYVDEAGRYADFHALRHTTGSWLAASGVHPKVAQAILRHSDINLTMSRYTHTLRGQEAEAVKSLPDLSTPSTEVQRGVVTGTDGQAVVDPARSHKQWTPRWTPELTPTAFSACSQLSSDCATRGNTCDDSITSKQLLPEQLGNESRGLSMDVTNQKAIRPAGFEPATPGLGNRCSILLSYGRAFSKSFRLNHFLDLPSIPFSPSDGRGDCQLQAASFIGVNNRA